MAETAITARSARPSAPSGGIEKAAVLLLTLGSNAASAIFKHLTDAEARQVSGAMARLRTIPRAQAAAVHEEAWRWLSHREGFLVDGEQFVRQLVAAGAEHAPRELGRPGRAPDDLGAQLEPIAPQVLAQV